MLHKFFVIEDTEKAAFNFVGYVGYFHVIALCTLTLYSMQSKKFEKIYDCYSAMERCVDAKRIFSGTHVTQKQSLAEC